MKIGVYYRAVIATLSILGFSAAAQAALVWSTAYSQTAANSAAMQQLRAVEVADQAGNDSVYTGFIQNTGAPGTRDIVRFSTNSPYTQLNTRGGSNDQPKSIATDEFGNVFAGNRISGGTSSKITVHSATLGAGTDYTVGMPTNQFGGLALVKVGGTPYLYASRESGGEVRRYSITYSGSTVTNITLDTTFGTSGIFALGTGGGILRGIDVASDGTIFVASRDDGKLYKIDPALTSVTSAAVPKAMDVVLYNGLAYVTSYNGTSSLIGVIDEATLAANPNITISTLDGNPYSRGSLEGWGGMDIDSTGRIWLADENYSGTTSIAGDRLLVSSPLPEPGTLTLLPVAIAFRGKSFRRKSR